MISEANKRIEELQAAEKILEQLKTEILPEDLKSYSTLSSLRSIQEFMVKNEKLIKELQISKGEDAAMLIHELSNNIIQIHRLYEEINNQQQES